MTPFPLRLRRAIQRDRLVVVVGPQLGARASWEGLFRALIERCAEAGALAPDVLAHKGAALETLPPAVRRAELNVLREALHCAGAPPSTLRLAFLREAQQSPGPAHRALALMAPRAFLTPNHDNLLELSLEGYGTHTWADGASASRSLEQGRRVVLKAHGCASREDTVLLSRREVMVAAQDTGWRTTLHELLDERTWLFVGFGGEDPLDPEQLLGGAAAELSVSGETHYALLADAGDDAASALREDWGIETLTLAAADALGPALAELALARHRYANVARLAREAGDPERFAAEHPGLQLVIAVDPHDYEGPAGCAPFAELDESEAGDQTTAFPLPARQGGEEEPTEEASLASADHLELLRPGSLYLVELPHPGAPPLSVGRELSNDLPVLAAEHDTVSSRHGRLEHLEDGSLSFVDVGSANGTLVNGQPLANEEPRALADGDLLEIGAVKAFALGPQRLWAVASREPAAN